MVNGKQWTAPRGPSHDGSKKKTRGSYCGSPIGSQNSSRKSSRSPFTSISCFRVRIARSCKSPLGGKFTRVVSLCSKWITMTSLRRRCCQHRGSARLGSIRRPRPWSINSWRFETSVITREIKFPRLLTMLSAPCIQYSHSSWQRLQGSALTANDLFSLFSKLNTFLPLLAYIEFSFSPTRRRRCVYWTDSVRWSTSDLISLLRFLVLSSAQSQ